jgi:hypothetical protein
MPVRARRDDILLSKLRFRTSLCLLSLYVGPGDCP